MAKNWVTQAAHYIMGMLPPKRADRRKVLQQVDRWVEEEGGEDDQTRRRSGSGGTKPGRLGASFSGANQAGPKPRNKPR